MYAIFLKKKLYNFYSSYKKDNFNIFLAIGAGGAAKEYKTSFHLFASIIKNEGITGAYAGCVNFQNILKPVVPIRPNSTQ